ncbi:hypothetical protein F2P81_021025 [Scophthalmus maximus]|uniref:Uncharacterized protein n=1 Tax=Scophthalmus maximus TaxID=52904 RepID=A0A6A4S295_SCOMX|nr:hypothetical protein F2P81_021025 [Scophthalmus maximus]
MGKENGADFKILQSNYHNFTNYDHSFKQYHMISYPVNLDSAIETKQSLLQAGERSDDICADSDDEISKYVRGNIHWIL